MGIKTSFLKLFTNNSTTDGEKRFLNYRLEQNGEKESNITIIDEWAESIDNKLNKSVKDITSSMKDNTFNVVLNDDTAKEVTIKTVGGSGSELRVFKNSPNIPKSFTPTVDVNQFDIVANETDDIELVLHGSPLVKTNEYNTTYANGVHTVLLDFTLNANETIWYITSETTFNYNDLSNAPRVMDNLTTVTKGDALDASQGKLLNDKTNILDAQINALPTKNDAIIKMGNLPNGTVLKNFNFSISREYTLCNDYTYIGIPTRMNGLWGTLLQLGKSLILWNINGVEMWYCTNKDYLSTTGFDDVNWSIVATRKEIEVITNNLESLSNTSVRYIYQIPIEIIRDANCTYPYVGVFTNDGVLLTDLPAGWYHVSYTSHIHGNGFGTQTFIQFSTSRTFRRGSIATTWNPMIELTSREDVNNLLASTVRYNANPSNDANDFIISGIHHINANTLNVPNLSLHSAASSEGELEVYVWEPNHVIQVYRTIYSGRSSSRTMINGVWTPWEENAKVHQLPQYHVANLGISFINGFTQYIASAGLSFGGVVNIRLFLTRPNHVITSAGGHHVMNLPAFLIPQFRVSAIVPTYASPDMQNGTYQQAVVFIHPDGRVTIDSRNSFCLAEINITYNTTAI